MTSLSGHMIIKNGIKYDFPFLESCLSILPICDEFVFVEGFSEDDTHEHLITLREIHPKIRIVRAQWTKKDYTVLSHLTNIAIERCKCDYHFQIQADEVVHEKYLDDLDWAIKSTNFEYSKLGVLHFYGSFRKVYKPLVFYDWFVRLAKRSTYPKLRSYGDAMTLGAPETDPATFRLIDLSGIKVHHYGYVRKPMCLIEKQEAARPLWGACQDELFTKGLQRGHIEWDDKHHANQLDDYTDSHPLVLKKWIEEREEMVEAGRLS